MPKICQDDGNRSKIKDLLGPWPYRKHNFCVHFCKSRYEPLPSGAKRYKIFLSISRVKTSKILFHINSKLFRFVEAF